MRHAGLFTAVVAATAVLAGCADQTTAPEQTSAAPGMDRAALDQGAIRFTESRLSVG